MGIIPSPSIKNQLADTGMDCPCLLGTTLNSSVQISSHCSCLSVRLAACRFDSPAALYLFVSARIYPQPPTPLFCLAQQSSPHLTCSLICRTRMWPPLGPNRRYWSSSLFGLCCVWPSLAVLFFVVSNFVVLFLFETVNGNNSGANVKTLRFCLVYLVWCFLNCSILVFDVSLFKSFICMSRLWLVNLNCQWVCVTVRYSLTVLRLSGNSY